jgi:predicted membrane protein
MGDYPMNLQNGFRHGGFFAVMLIVAGALLLLDNLGLLPVQDIRAYWPLWFVFWGFWILSYRKTVHAIIWSTALISAGVLLVLGNLQIIHATPAVIWPLVLIAFGVLMLVRPVRPGLADWPERLRQRSLRRSHFRSSRSPDAGQSFHGDRLDESAVFSSINRTVDTQNFDGGKLDCVFASIEVDLTTAAISSPGHTAVLEANAVFGGIEITVPRNWKVVMKSTAVFGGCEDRTVPPRPEAGIPLSTLVVTGGAVFGGVSVRN